MAARIPAATYRLQIHAGFDLARAEALLDYLQALGITDVYTSPLLPALPGSPHGYDVIDHGCINPEVGGDAAFERFARNLQGREMGLVVDTVPNHMCVAGGQNRWWMDVLENGPSSTYANHFDIDWDPPMLPLKHKVLLPVLPDQYGRVLEQELKVEFRDGAFFVIHAGVPYPFAPRTWRHVLEGALVRLRRELHQDADALMELESILTALAHLPMRTETEPERVRERLREKEIVRRRMVALVEKEPRARAAIEAAVKEINGRKEDPRTFDPLEAALAEQGYRLSHWRVAADEINYRRFFDINDLAAIRVEEPQVFHAVHDLLLRHAAAGLVTGARIDHVDGLFDPEKYLRDLENAWTAVRTVGGRAREPVQPYVVVEKILGENEHLPSEWKTHGTTGYEVMNLLCEVLVDTDAAHRLSGIAGRFGAGERRFADVVHDSKRLVLHTAMSSELTVLARKLDRVSEQHRYSRDFTLNSLQEVLSEVIAAFPVYRTYVRPGDTTVSDRDRAAIELAFRRAQRRNPAIFHTVFGFVKSLLLLEQPDGLDDQQKAVRHDFVLKFQQLTGPVMAKGVEDTSFYRWAPLAALNEVGGEPGRIGVPIGFFHRRCRERLERTPHALSATATHDSKRGEDTRARLAALSEMPLAWARAIERWRELNLGHKTDVAGTVAPDQDEEYLVYQTLVGTWPAGGLASEPDYEGRIQAYMNKAIKEAKVNTSWVQPNEAHEDAVRGFLSAILNPTVSETFQQEFHKVVRTFEWAGYWNGLAQVTLKMAMPGVPDFYQGTELWDFSLVDPDNRRPVDYGRRRTLLEGLRKSEARDPCALMERLMRRPEDGAIKLFVTYRGLALRQRKRPLFDLGRYEACEVEGPRAEQVIAFCRHRDGDAVICVTGRFFTRFGRKLRRPVGELWKDTVVKVPTSILQTNFVDAIAGHDVRAGIRRGMMVLAVDQALAHAPVALLQGTN
jgi:(1->4)-alpha-D-glucan 1-alpha-D-glucosylmutase